MPRRTKADTVYDALRDLIISGAVGPGERLRQEEVARRWHVSATPVREAFRRLESDGLVQYEANRGVVVRGQASSPPGDGLASLARRWNDLLAAPESFPGSDFP